jgi:hypothetical protein
MQQPVIDEIVENNIFLMLQNLEMEVKLNTFLNSQKVVLLVVLWVLMELLRDVLMQKYVIPEMHLD